MVHQEQLPSVLFITRIKNKSIEHKTRTCTEFLHVRAENLKWKEHVNLNANKVSKSIGIIACVQTSPVSFEEEIRDVCTQAKPLLKALVTKLKRSPYVQVTSITAVQFVHKRIQIVC